MFSHKQSFWELTESTILFSKELLYCIVVIIIIVLIASESLGENNGRIYSSGSKSIYERFGVDTTGGESTVSVVINTNGDFSELESLGIKIAEKQKRGDGIHVHLPVHMLSTVSNLESVLGIRFDIRAVYQDLRLSKLQVIPGTGMVSGVYLLNRPVSGCNAEIILKKGSYLITQNEIDSCKQAEIVETKYIPISGRFGFHNLPEGIYHGVVLTYNGDSLITKREYLSVISEVIIDSILIKPDNISFVADTLLTPNPGYGDNYFIWNESLHPMRKE